MFIAHLQHADGTFEISNSMIDTARVLREAGANLWVDLEAPDEWTLMLLGEAFSFHPLAIEDCLHAEQRPRIDPYEGHIFMVIYAPMLNDDNEFLGARELAIFCSPQFIVTIHHEPLKSLAMVRERCCRDPENVLGRGMDHLLHAIVDSVIDGYQPILDGLEGEATELEDAASTDPNAEVMTNISDRKRHILQIRRYLNPLRESIGQLARGEYAFIGKNIQPYFRDVLDHLLRTLDLLEFYREQLVEAREVYLSTLTQRTNEVIKSLTVWATIGLPPVLISSIYGMNYPLWPPQDHPFSFWGIVGFMLAMSAGMLFWFRRAHWL